MSREAMSWQLRRKAKKRSSCSPRCGWPQVCLTFSFITWPHLEFLSPLHRLFKACWFFIKESGSNLLLNSFHLHHPPFKPHYNITNIQESSVLVLSIGKHFFVLQIVRRVPSCGKLQTGCNSRPENQLEKCSSDALYSLILPCCLSACFLWISEEQLLQYSSGAVAASPSPSPLLADGGKPYSTGTRMLPVCPPIKEIPLEVGGVGVIKRGPIISLPLNPFLTQRRKVVDI